MEGFRNLWWFRKVIWRWRFWDFDYQLLVIDKMLEKCEEEWGVSTHHVGDQFTRGRIRVVRRMYKRLGEISDPAEEYVARCKFLQAYVKLLPTLWD